MIRVLIAEDHTIVRLGLKQLLEETGKIKVTAQSTDYPETIKAIRTHELDIVILDISIPGKNGIDILKQIKDEKPGLGVLILSMHPEDQYAVRAIKAGASGYLTKHTAPEKLIEAIYAIRAGKRYITTELAESLANHLTEDTQKPLHETLSDREFQTIRLIASGKKLSEIAEELSLSPKTVSVYRCRILEKMRMKSNAELTHYALKNGLID
jgi:two-component system invasion response regulator UvrY